MLVGRIVSLPVGVNGGLSPEGGTGLVTGSGAALAGVSVSEVPVIPTIEVVAVGGEVPTPVALTVVALTKQSLS